jgi:small nuclear ribonucleoprotein
VYIISDNQSNQNLSEIDKLLQQNIGKDVLVRLKNNITVHGKLKNFDQHLNLFLNEGRIESKEGTEKLQEMLLRGSDVLVISI